MSKNVFCKDCKFRIRWISKTRFNIFEKILSYFWSDGYCSVKPIETYNPVTGRKSIEYVNHTSSTGWHSISMDCKYVNEKCNCEYFEKKGK